MMRPVLRNCFHPQRGNGDFARPIDPRQKVRPAALLVHQKPDSSQIQAVGGDNSASIEHLMQCLEHETISAKDNHRFSIVQRDPVNQVAQLCLGFLCAFRVGRE
jgi:hypothetical protein